MREETIHRVCFVLDYETTLGLELGIRVLNKIYSLFFGGGDCHENVSDQLQDLMEGSLMMTDQGYLVNFYFSEGSALETPTRSLGLSLCLQD